MYLEGKEETETSYSKKQYCYARVTYNIHYFMQMT